jgi:hypothetical protein
MKKTRATIVTSEVLGNVAAEGMCARNSVEETVLTTFPPFPPLLDQPECTRVSPFAGTPLTVGCLFLTLKSGLAVEPNTNELAGRGSNRDAVFGLAQDAGNVEDGEQIRRTITMVSFVICLVLLYPCL